MSLHPTIGVLAYQGDVREHRSVLDGLGVRSLEVRTLADLDRVDGLIVPGGESTVIGKLTERYGLLEPIRGRARAGLPVFGTCAGMIFMAREVEGPPQQLLGVLDARVRRNAFGPQVASFEADVDVKGIDGGPVSAAFIRAPWISDAGPDVEVLAEIDGRVIGVRQGNLLAVAFHPELTGDSRLHRWFVDLARAAVERGVHGQPPDPA
jgi:5'-phosphate synthase pdxT subunit